jgi:hypothetical protein
MTDLEKMRRDYEEMGRSLKAMEGKEAAKRPELVSGQIWKHANGDMYIVHWAGTSKDYASKLFSLVTIVGNGLGRAWAVRGGFGGQPEYFTYIGMAEDVLSIKLPK